MSSNTIRLFTLISFLMIIINTGELSLRAKESFNEPVVLVERKVLKKKQTFADQVVQSNTKYIIKHSFDLKGRTIVMPENCEVLFKRGGCLCNGKLKLNKTKISNNKLGSLKVELEGEYNYIFDLYDSGSPQINKSIVEVCRAGIRLKSDIRVYSCNLYTSLYGDGHSISFDKKDIVGFYILSNGITISNVTINKPLLDAHSHDKRRAIYLSNVNDFTLEHSTINGQLFFRSDAIANGNNIHVFKCCINADFSLLEQDHTFENDVITAYGVKNMVVDNCLINAKNVTRVFKTSASNYFIDSQGDYKSYSNSSSNIVISNNTITSFCSHGKQLFDMFIGTKDVIIKNNKITAIGHTRLFENKTAQDGAVSKSLNYSTTITISDNVCTTDAGFVYINILDPSDINVSNNSVNLTDNFNREIALIHNVNSFVMEENTFIQTGGSTHSPIILVSEDFKDQNSRINTLKIRDNVFDVASALFMSIRNVRINEFSVIRNNVPDIIRGVQFRNNAIVDVFNVEHRLVREKNYLIHTLKGACISQINIDVPSVAGNRILLDESSSIGTITSQQKIHVYKETINDSIIRRYINN